MTTNVHRLEPRPQTFLTLLVRVQKMVSMAKVTRLKEPLGVILGLDNLTLNYMLGRFLDYSKTRAVPQAGQHSGGHWWHDHMPQVAIGSSSPSIRDLLGRLVDDAILVHQGGITAYERVTANNSKLYIDIEGAYWTFEIEGSSYATVHIPEIVFRTGRK